MEVIIFLPAVLVAVPAYFIHLHFFHTEKIIGWRMGIAALWLLLILFLIVYGTVFIDFGFGVLFIGMCAIVVAFISGVYLLIFLRKWQKIFGIVIGIVFPLIMFATYTTALDYSPHAIMRKDGLMLAVAIEQYKEDVGQYPQSLQDLMPAYVNELNGPQDQYGWLYVSTEEDFNLGYVSWIDRFGTYVTMISSKDREWDNFMDSPDLFNLGPTPGPTEYPPP